MDALVPVVVDTLEFSVDVRAYDVDFLIFGLVPVNTKAEYYADIFFSTLAASNSLSRGGNNIALGTERVVSLTRMTTLSPGCIISLKRPLDIGFCSAFKMIVSGLAVMRDSVGTIVSTVCVSGIFNDTDVFPNGSSSFMVMDVRSVTLYSFCSSNKLCY